MTVESKQLEGLGRLLRAAGVKPAGAEQLIRAHLDNLHEDARLQHADMMETVRTLEAELIELRHNHSFSMAEIRMATDLMRREVEAKSSAFTQTLRLAKAAMACIFVAQIAILLIMSATPARRMMRTSSFDAAPAVAKVHVDAAVRSPAPNQNDKSRSSTHIPGRS